MPNTTISELSAYQIYDSRGQPTVESKLKLSNGITVFAAVPSGASTGIFEAVELRDGDKNDHSGKSVHNAIENVNTIISPALQKMTDCNILNQSLLDDVLLKLDGTENKSKLGANAILSASICFTKASAEELGIPIYKRVAQMFDNVSPSLPVPFFNVINGGAHSGNLIAFQEFMIAPIGASSFKEAMKMGSEIYHALKILINKKYGSKNINVGDEGGFAPDLSSVEECLDLLVETIESCQYTGKVAIALDVAASEFHLDSKFGHYDLDIKNLSTEGHRILSGEEMVNYYLNLIDKYPIISIEDPFDQNDWDSWCNLTSKTTIQIVGDDLTVTNPKRIQRAIDCNACNALLLKINQIGSITESLEAAKIAKSAGWNIMVSHRSGETEDTFISDLVVGLGVGQIKSGAPCRSERVAKYNRLLRIENTDNTLRINNSISSKKHPCL